ncbi:MAG: aminoacetone oxidase family FAD-binding enzyme [Clostridiales bacterium]|nr:aminoacetone oxidase family FAD-binding enzyme [Clostridiales bacterium]
MRKSIVIGAGASGMMAAVFAARGGGEVLLIEKEKQAGKKLLTTGSGRCNLTNRDMDLSHYYSDDIDFVNQVLSFFDSDKTLEFFNSLGLLTREKSGWIYPRTNEAKSVREVLLRELQRLGVKLRLNTEITGICKTRAGFKVLTESGFCYECDKLILTCGSPAGLKAPQEFRGYNLAKEIGCTIEEPTPALVQLFTSNKGKETLSGLRAEGAVRFFYSKGKKQLTSKIQQGELQFTKKGISGIAVMCLSGDCLQMIRHGFTAIAAIDFFPELSEEELQIQLEKAKPFGYVGLLPEKLLLYLKDTLSSIDTKELSHLLKNFKLHVEGGGSFSDAQVARGGVPVSEIDPGTMESRRIKGVYLAGEMVNVDGVCGGYNLQWAWASGALSGFSSNL